MGVAVRDNNGHSLVVGLDKTHSGKAKFCSTYNSADLCSTSTTEFNGWENTQAVKHEDGVAKVAAAYTFADGQNGYIGSYAEWNLVKSRKDAINNALTILGRSILDYQYWTSTYSGNQGFMWAIASDYTFNTSSKMFSNDRNGGRIFAKLPEGLEW